MYTGSSSVGRVHALGAWCRRFESCLPDYGGIMKENDKLPTIIATIATIIFIVFVLIISQPKEIDGLQGGDIQHAIDTNQ